MIRKEIGINPPCAVIITSDCLKGCLTLLAEMRHDSIKEGRLSHTCLTENTDHTWVPLGNLTHECQFVVNHFYKRLCHSYKKWENGFASIFIQSSPSLLVLSVSLLFFYPVQSAYAHKRASYNMLLLEVCQ